MKKLKRLKKKRVNSEKIKLEILLGNIQKTTICSGNQGWILERTTIILNNSVNIQGYMKKQRRKIMRN
jgi:hypothetical protein